MSVNLLFNHVVAIGSSFIGNEVCHGRGVMLPSALALLARPLPVCVFVCVHALAASAHGQPLRYNYCVRAERGAANTGSFAVAIMDTSQ